MKTQSPIKGKRNKKSWEKQTLWDLSNGTTVTEEYNPYYGLYIKRIDDKEGYWCASSGLQTLPERFSFLLAWVKGGDGPAKNLIQPNFEKAY